MNKNFQILILVSFMSFNVYAEKWIYVDENIYVDTDSRERKGDLATLRYKLNGNLSYVEIDCKNKIYLKPAQKKDDRVEKDSIMGIILNIACAKWYEVWK